MIIFVTLLLATWMTRAGLGKETIDRCEFLLMHRLAFCGCADHLISGNAADWTTSLQTR